MREKRQAGFTLVELLVVIAIIGILIALLLPAVQAAREAARRLQCQNNLKQIALALQNYDTSHRCFPAGVAPVESDDDDARYLGWQWRILPFLEAGTAGDQAQATAVASSGGNIQTTLSNLKIPGFLCPSALTQQHQGATADDVRYLCHYLGVMGPIGTNPAAGSNYKTSLGGGSATCEASVEGVLLRDEVVELRDVQDGTANTLVAGELSWEDSNWYTDGWGYATTGTPSGCSVEACLNVKYPLCEKALQPGGADANNTSFGSEHAGGANFAVVDGTVRFLLKDVDLTIFRSATSRAGGEPSEMPK